MCDLFESIALPNTLQIKVIPKAKSERVKKEIKSDGSELYKVYVLVAPENGKANDAVIKLLAKFFGLKKSQLRIIQGLKSREKVISLNLA